MYHCDLCGELPGLAACGTRSAMVESHCTEHHHAHHGPLAGRRGGPVHAKRFETAKGGRVVTRLTRGMNPPLRG